MEQIPPPMTNEQRAEVAAQFGVALDASVQAFKAFGASCATAGHVFAALGEAARLADINARAEARRRRAALREHFGCLCVLLPEWWTLRRLERDGFGS